MFCSKVFNKVKIQKLRQDLESITEEKSPFEKSPTFKDLKVSSSVKSFDEAINSLKVSQQIPSRPSAYELREQRDKQHRMLLQQIRILEEELQDLEYTKAHLDNVDIQRFEEAYRYLEAAYHRIKNMDQKCAKVLLNNLELQLSVMTSSVDSKSTAVSTERRSTDSTPKN